MSLKVGASIGTYVNKEAKTTSYNPNHSISLPDKGKIFLVSAYES